MRKVQRRGELTRTGNNRLWGCARAYCANCQHSELIAFSCKRRSLCPSCDAKRSLLFAEHLHQNILRYKEAIIVSLDSLTQMIVTPQPSERNLIAVQAAASNFLTLAPRAKKGASKECMADIQAVHERSTAALDARKMWLIRAERVHETTK